MPSLVRQAQEQLASSTITDVVVGDRRPKWAVPVWAVAVTAAAVVFPDDIIAWTIGAALSGLVLSTASIRFFVVGGTGGPTYLVAVPKWSFGSLLAGERGVVTAASLARKGRVRDTWSINGEQIMLPKKQRDIVMILTQAR